MSLNNFFMLLLIFMLSACVKSPVLPFKPPPPEKPYATLQAGMTYRLLLSDIPILLIQAINGKTIDAKEEAWKLQPYTSFNIPIGNTFVKMEESFDGYFGYVHFYAKKGKHYTVTYTKETQNRYRFTVTDSQLQKVDTRTFARCNSSTSYENRVIWDKLLDAIALNDVDEVKRLLQVGADLSTFPSYGLNPLSLAALENNLEIAQILISASVCVNANKSVRALKHAVNNRNLAMAKVLLDNGADINYRQYADDSALMLAARSGNIKMVELFLQHGAYTQFHNYEGKTALDLAKEASYEEIVELIIQNAD